MLDKKAIEAIIPHRDPFLLIDEITELVPGVSAVAIKYVTGDEDFFRGHFPGMPVMPGVLVIEAMAQAGAACALSHELYKGKIAFFGGLDKVRFRRKVVPGDILRLEVFIEKIRGPVGKGRGKAFVGDEIAAEAELTFFIGD